VVEWVLEIRGDYLLRRKASSNSEEQIIHGGKSPRIPRNKFSTAEHLLEIGRPIPPKKSETFKEIAKQTFFLIIIKSHFKTPKMKIETFKFSNLRNEEHYQFHSEVKQLIERFTPEALKVTDKYAPYPGLYDNEGEALNLICKSEITQQLVDADLTRDLTFQGFCTTVRGALNHYDTAIKDAAQRLDMLLEHYGNVHDKSYDEESASIVSLVSDLRKTYTQDLATAGLTGWVDKLMADNHAFVTLLSGRYAEDANRTRLRMKSVRVEMDAVYREVVDHINALITIEGEAGYSDFVNEINSRIEKTKLNLAQRRGRNAKTAAKEAEVIAKISNQ
jgi:hypothetical protein